MLPDEISLDTVVLACCQQHHWAQALKLRGLQGLSMESLEVLVTACQAQHVHQVACHLLMDFTWTRLPWQILGKHTQLLGEVAAVGIFAGIATSNHYSHHLPLS